MARSRLLVTWGCNWLDAPQTTPSKVAVWTCGPTLFLNRRIARRRKDHAREGARPAYRILRLTPDEWMAPLFGQSDATAAATSSRAG